MKNEKTIQVTSVLISLSILLVLIYPLVPFIILALGQPFDFVSKKTLYNEANAYLEAKYSANMDIKYIDKISGTRKYDGMANSIDDDYPFNLAGFKINGDIYFQDDYALQLLIRPIIDKEFGKRNEIYEVSYSHPYLLDHYREEGMESLLEKRIENNVRLDIVFYNHNPDKKEYLNKFKRIQEKLNTENIKVSNLAVRSTRKENINKDFLYKDSDTKWNAQIEACYLDQTQELSCIKHK